MRAGGALIFSEYREPGLEQGFMDFVGDGGGSVGGVNEARGGCERSAHRLEGIDIPSPAGGIVTHHEVIMSCFPSLSDFGFGLGVNNFGNTVNVFMVGEAGAPNGRDVANIFMHGIGVIEWFKWVFARGGGL